MKYQFAVLFFVSTAIMCCFGITAPSGFTYDTPMRAPGITTGNAELVAAVNTALNTLWNNNDWMTLANQWFGQTQKSFICNANSAIYPWPTPTAGGLLDTVIKTNSLYLCSSPPGLEQEQPYWQNNSGIYTGFEYQMGQKVVSLMNQHYGSNIQLHMVAITSYTYSFQPLNEGYCDLYNRAVFAGVLTATQYPGAPVKTSDIFSVSCSYTADVVAAISGPAFYTFGTNTANTPVNAQTLNAQGLVLGSFKTSTSLRLVAKSYVPNYNVANETNQRTSYTAMFDDLKAGKFHALIGDANAFLYFINNLPAGQNPADYQLFRFGPDFPLSYIGHKDAVPTTPAAVVNKNYTPTIAGLAAAVGVLALAVIILALRLRAAGSSAKSDPSNYHEMRGGSSA